jgi:DNA-directed RNA polymerase specialized sigma24 family protein
LIVGGKAMTKEVSFPNQAALISWAFVVILRDAMDWLDRRGRKVAVLDENVLAILDRHQQSQELWQVDLPLDRLRALYPQLNDKSSGLQLIDVYALTVQDDVGLEILGVKLISPESN